MMLCRGRAPPRPGYDGSPVLAECAAGGLRHRAFHPVAHASTLSERRLTRIMAPNSSRARSSVRRSSGSRGRLQILRSLQIDDGYRIFIQDKTFHFPQTVAATQNGFAYPTKHMPARRV